VSLTKNNNAKRRIVMNKRFLFKRALAILTVVAMIIIFTSLLTWMVQYTPHTATAISVICNCNNMSVREYTESIKNPIPANNKSENLIKVFKFIVHFKGYINIEKYQKKYPSDALWVSGVNANNDPDDMTGLIFTDDIAKHRIQFY